MAQRGEDLDLVVAGQLLQDVGEALVVQLHADLHAALGRHLVQGVGDVGGAHLPVAGREQRGALLALVGEQAADVVEVDLRGPAAAAAQAAGVGPLAHEDPGDLPVAVALDLQGHVLDHGGGAGTAGVPPAVGHPRQHHRALQQVGEDEDLGGPLLEAAHVHQAGGDHLARAHRGHPRDGHEDPPPTGDLRDQPHRPGAPLAAGQQHDVAHAAHRVAQGVEDRQAGEPRDEHSRGGGDHCRRVVRARAGPPVIT